MKIDEYLEQKRADVLQTLYNEVCEMEQSVFDITRPFYNDILKDKLKYVFIIDISNSYDRLILLSKQILFFQISDEVKVGLLEVRKFVNNFLKSIDKLNEALSVKKPDIDKTSDFAQDVADKMTYGGFDTTISEIKKLIKGDIKK